MFRFAPAAAFAAALLLPTFAAADQVVLLDFDSGTDANERAYTQSERDAVQARMEGHYNLFDVTFTQSAPAAGTDFSTVRFNVGDPGGRSLQEIDFRNLNRNDAAVVNVDGIIDAASAGSAEFVNASAGIGSHELGHMLGLRHHDSYGPIGSGVAPGLRSNYLPDYPGPADATETNDHVMASPDSVGSSDDDLQTPSWFSERSAIKLNLAEDPDANVVAEASGFKGSLLTAQAVDLVRSEIPNAIERGMNAGKRLFADAVTVVGSLDAVGETDFYAFDALAGDLLNIELMSGALAASRRAIGTAWNAFDTIVRVRREGGGFVDYFGTPATNDDELEGTDSQILDLTLPEDGRYYVQVDAFGAGSGDYELFFHTFSTAAVPEPGTWALIGLAAAAAGARRRSRRGPAADVAA